MCVCVCVFVRAWNDTILHFERNVECQNVKVKCLYIYISTNSLQYMLTRLGFWPNIPVLFKQLSSISYSHIFQLRETWLKNEVDDSILWFSLLFKTATNDWAAGWKENQTKCRKCNSLKLMVMAHIAYLSLTLKNYLKSHNINNKKIA